MSNNNVRNIHKIPRWVVGKYIKFIGRFNHEIYMKLYIKYLIKQGMDVQGTPIYIGATTTFDGKDYSKIHIGDKSVISSDVLFLTHDYSISRAIEATGRKLDKEVCQIKDIHVGKNCFIGTRSILMPGCQLGNNIIVGAGSVVRGKIPDNSMVIGNPACIIGDVREWAEKKNLANDVYVNY